MTHTFLIYTGTGLREGDVEGVLTVTANKVVRHNSTVSLYGPVSHAGPKAIGKLLAKLSVEPGVKIRKAGK